MVPDLEGCGVGRDFGKDSNVCESRDTEDSNYIDPSYGWSATHL